jgi:hypothetical protein
MHRPHTTAPTRGGKAAMKDGQELSDKIVGTLNYVLVLIVHYTLTEILTNLSCLYTKLSWNN